MNCLWIFSLSNLPKLFFIVVVNLFWGIRFQNSCSFWRFGSALWTKRNPNFHVNPDRSSRAKVATGSKVRRSHGIEFVGRSLCSRRRCSTWCSAVLSPGIADGEVVWGGQHHLHPDLLVGLKKIFEVQFEPPFFWVGMPQQKEKETEKVCGPFFWLKPTEAGWLASIFGLQVEDTLHFCCFPSNIAIIQSSQSSNHVLSVSLLQIRNTSKDLGLGCWTSHFFSANQNPLQAALAGQLPTRYNIGTSGHFYFAQGRPQRGINGVITPIIRVITPVTHL